MEKIRLVVKRLLLVTSSIILLSFAASSQVVPLPYAYAHNDYWHKRPLFDALDNGFTHLEADVYLRHSKLLVAHRPPLLKLLRRHTIEGLYLQPILNRLASTSPDAKQTALDTLVLMIDIKSKGERTYTALRKLLKNYTSILSTCINGKVIIRNLTLVLTGHRPMHLLESEESRYVFADADLKKINSSEDSPEMFATASCKYSSLMSWKGKGAIPEVEKERLEELVGKAHLSGTKVRLWASPENEAVWLFLRNCGVDLINTDKLVALKKFFMKGSNNRGLNASL